VKLLRSVIVQDQLIAADGVQQFELPVNPISHLLLGIRPLNDTGTLANFNRANGLAASMNRITINHLGSPVFSMRGEDCLALNYFRHGMIPFEANGDDTNDERRCLSLPVLFGRHPYDKSSAMPKTNRGELILELDIDIADTGYDGLRLTVESVEMLGASPKEFERKTSINRTSPATGLQDILLPSGNKVRGLLLFGTTPFGGAAPAPSWGRVQTLIDNEMEGISSADWEMLHQDSQLFGIQPPTGQRHIHRVTTDGNAQTELATLAGPAQEGLGDQWNQYAWVDFDPTHDDEFSIDTRGKDWRIRYDAETADAVRVVQVERITMRDVSPT
jgi:hypothetical protein